MIFDVRRHLWSDEILSSIGLEASRLAQPLASGAVVGEIPAAVAEDLGLPKGVRVVAGGHDQPCGALGAGVVEPGRAMYATGTVECICPAFEKPIIDKRLFENNVCTYDYTIDGMYTTVVYSLTGGNLLKWYRDQWAQREVQLAKESGKSEYELILAGMASEPTNLSVLPYFTPSGTPYFDAKVPGAILGLRLETTQGQVLRGLLEGVAMEMRLNVDILDRSGLGIDEFRAIGGGAKNPLLTQLKADVLGRPITTLEVTEAGCLGVAMLACAADQGSDCLRELAGAWVKPASMVEPDRKRTQLYAEKFEQYKQLYPTLGKLY
jgi:xylulokinase